MWEELYLRLHGTGSFIRSIWVADVAHQGMSSVLNEDYLGNDREMSSNFGKRIVEKGQVDLDWEK